MRGRAYAKREPSPTFLLATEHQHPRSNVFRTARLALPNKIRHHAEPKHDELALHGIDFHRHFLNPFEC